MIKFEWIKEDGVIYTEPSWFTIMDGKLFVVIDRGEHEVAKSEDIEVLKQMADKYVVMLEHCSELGYDCMDVMPLPQSDEVKVSQGFCEWSESIKLSELQPYKKENTSKFNVADNEKAPR